MALCTKRRRKLQFGDRAFFWNVKEDRDYTFGLHLTVISEDKKFLIDYALCQSTEHSVIFVVKNGWQTDFDSRGCFRCPQWEIDGIITPRSVRNLLAWCCDRNEPKIQVDYLGREL